MTQFEILSHCEKYNYSDEYRDYWLAHRTCEYPGCNKVSFPPHHIRTRGAGGTDEEGNLLAFCATHHNRIHTRGVRTTAREAGGEMESKIYKALGLTEPAESDTLSQGGLL